MLRQFATGLPGLLLAGCVSQPTGLVDLASYTSAADPGGSTVARPYSPIVGAYTPRSPVSPTGWRGTGVEVTPLAAPADAIGGPQASEPTDLEQTK